MTEQTAMENVNNAYNHCEEAINTLVAGRDKWANLNIQDRIHLLTGMIRNTLEVSTNWVAMSVSQKRLTTPYEIGQEWLSGPYCLIRHLRLIQQTLIQINEKGLPQLPGAPFLNYAGQVVAPVFPGNKRESYLYDRMHAEIWMDPSVSLDNIHDQMACVYRQARIKPEICLVYSGGNVSSLGPSDCLHKLFAERKAVLLKLHPVNDYLSSVLERIFVDVISIGALQLVSGGLDESQYLANHSEINTIHLTGSHKTYDAIVYGSQENKKNNIMINDKQITSELGNVSPWIIAPEKWSDKDIQRQAVNVASSLVNNAGFNCNATRVIITSVDWPHRAAFLEALAHCLKKTPTRYAYYPGAGERYERFRRQYPSGVDIGNATAENLPWLLIPNIDASQTNELAFNEEAFCGVITEIALPHGKFMARAVNFANQYLWGSLNATIITNNPSQQSIKQAIAELEYGTVAINHWAGINYGLGVTTWGAFPKHSRRDIQSGNGVVHNTYLFDKPQKSVLYGPFKPRITPPWYVNHINPAPLAKHLCHYEANPQARRLFGVIARAMF